MDCQSFIDRLDDLLEGRLSDAERHGLREHMQLCAQCRELEAVLRGETGESAVKAPAGLVGAILERTSGSPCASARDRLVDHVDRQLAEVDDELVALHLERCVDCKSLAQAVARLTEELPLLAELEPDGRFVADVLASTLPRRTKWASWAARLAQSWQALLQRPRFAWEGAYVCTILLLLLFGLPVSPLESLPHKLLELATRHPVAELSEPVNRFKAEVTSKAEAVWDQSGRMALTTCREAATDVADLSAEAIGNLKSELGTISLRRTSEQEKTTTDSDHDDADRQNGEEQ